MTRSRQLVSLSHKAGHTICYNDVLRVDTSLAEESLGSMNYENDAVIPPNLVHGEFVHFSADSIDINDATLDGKNIFHGTQMAAWQRGPARDNVLHVPEAMDSGPSP